MAITETIQAKEFTAGAPDITLKGDLRPNQMMASAPDPMAELNQMALNMFGKDLRLLTEDELELLKDEYEIFKGRVEEADGGRAQYGLGSIVKSIGKAVKGAVKGVAKGVKSFAKSDLGKAALLIGGGMYAGGLGPFANMKGAGFLGNLSMPSFGLSTKGANTLKAFAIGSLGSAVLSAAEAGGLDTSDPNAEVDLDSLTGYLTKGYKNLNPNATDEEVFQFVQENTAEYRATGGRIGYDEGGKSLSDQRMEIIKGGGPKIVGLLADADKMMGTKGDRLEMALKMLLRDNKDNELLKYMLDTAEKRGTTKLDVLMDLIKSQRIQDIMAFDEGKKSLVDKISVKDLSRKEGSMKDGGRIGYAMGTDDKVMMAAGIEGLPVRQNKAGVKELDLRETGGFIQPVGIKEKADDIPAMLSNNEFVFTADAVRAAGGGDIDKGAQLMYDTMKKLESKVV